jgi:hypothetical protein
LVLRCLRGSDIAGGRNHDRIPGRRHTMTRNGYMLAVLGAAGAYWAIQRCGLADRLMDALRGTELPQTGGKRFTKGETIFHNNPLIGADVSHLGAAGSI